LKAVIEAL